MDWVAVDVYFQPHQRLARVMPTVRFLRRFTGRKPVLLGETGIDRIGNHSVCGQLAGIFAGIRRWGLLGMMYMDRDGSDLSRASWQLSARSLRCVARLETRYGYTHLWTR